MLASDSTNEPRTDALDCEYCGAKFLWHAIDSTYFDGWPIAALDADGYVTCPGCDKRQLPSNGQLRQFAEYDRRETAMAYLDDERDEADHGIVLIKASDVEPENVEFAWEGRIPLGMITLLVGNGGTAKSMLTHALAAGFSRGTIPGEFYGRPVNVAIASAEDHQAAVVRPRLEAAGADLDRVMFVRQNFDGEPDDIQLDGDVARLERTLAASGVRVLVVDTVVAHMTGKADSYKEQDVRRVLKPLKLMAERLGLAVVGIMHLNRRDTRDILTRISGSGGFGNLARSVLLQSKDPNEPEHSPVRILAHPKFNVGKEAATLRLHIEERAIYPGKVSITTGIIVIDGESDLTTAQLLGSDNENDGKLAQCKTWLAEFLADGPKPANDCFDAGMESETFSKATIRRAREALGIKPYKQGFKEWIWAMP